MVTAVYKMLCEQAACIVLWPSMMGTDELCLNPYPKAFKCEIFGETQNAIAEKGVSVVTLPNQLLLSYMPCTALNEGWSSLNTSKRQQIDHSTRQISAKKLSLITNEKLDALNLYIAPLALSSRIFPQ